MTLPAFIIEKMEMLCNGVSSKALAKAYERISLRYRGLEKPNQASIIENDLERLAYLIARFPATYAVNKSIGKQIIKELTHHPIKKMLDLGAGCGASSLAWMFQLETLEDIWLIERDSKLVALGQTLFEGHLPQKIKLHWEAKNIEDVHLCKDIDLILMSYSLNELKPDHISSLVNTLVQMTPQVIAFIEPGSPSGYELLMKCRDMLMSKGYFMLAPCPHENLCPMRGLDWCHFSTRLPRTSLHKLLKLGELGYEDEKYSYLVMTKSLPDKRLDRIVSEPKKHAGFIEFNVCKTEGCLENITIRKRDEDLFKAVKKLEWGETLPS